MLTDLMRSQKTLAESEEKTVGDKDHATEEKAAEASTRRTGTAQRPAAVYQTCLVDARWIQEQLIETEITIPLEAVKVRYRKLLTQHCNECAFKYKIKI